MSNPTAPRFLPPGSVFAIAIVTLFAWHASAHASITIHDTPSTLPSVTIGGIEYDVTVDWGSVGDSSLASGLSQADNRAAMNQIYSWDWKKDSGPERKRYTLFFGDTPQVAGGGMEIDGFIEWDYDSSHDLGMLKDNDYYGSVSVTETSSRNPKFGSVHFSEATAAVPEPSTLIIWSLLGLCGIGYGWKRRKA